MPITYLKGDIFELAAQRTDLHAIAFGTDIAGAMDSGISIAVKSRWPAFADAFRVHCETTKMQLGDVFEWRDNNLVLYALGIQRAGTKPTIAAFDRATPIMIAKATEANVQGIHLPRIGAGKEGLDWLRVKRILNDASAATPLSFIVFEQFVRTGGNANANAEPEEGTEAEAESADESADK